MFELLSLTGRKWWFRDLGDEIGSRSFCETVDQDTNEGNLDKDIEAETKSKKYSSTVLEPQLLLFLVVFNTRKVRLELEFCERLLRLKVGCDVPIHASKCVTKSKPAGT